MPRRMRHNLTLSDKCDILKKIENGVSSKIICKSFNINKSTVSRIRKNKEKIRKFSSECFVSTKDVKKIRKIYFPGTEKRLYEWFLNERRQNNNVTDEILRVKALEFHASIEPEKRFNGSNGWVTNFKKRHAIRLPKSTGEKLSKNDAVVPECIERFTTEIVDLDLIPDQICNANETGLAIRNRNDKTLDAIKEKTAPRRRKNSNDRIIRIPFVNSIGGHKVSLRLLRKTKSPRVFKDVIKDEDPDVMEERIESPDEGNHNIDTVIQYLNYIVDWAEEMLPVSDISFLQKIREKAVEDKCRSSI